MPHSNQTHGVLEAQCEEVLKKEVTGEKIMLKLMSMTVLP